MTWEITGRNAANGLFSFDELFRQLVTNTPAAVAYHSQPGPGACKRLVEHIKTLFYDASMSGFIGLGNVVCPVITFESFKLAFHAAAGTDTPMAAHLFGARLTNKMLEDAGLRVVASRRVWLSLREAQG